MKKFTILFFWFAFSYSTFAQNPSSKLPFRLGVSASYGFVYKHKREFGDLGSGRPYAFEASLNYLTNGSQPWHKLYHYPEIGLAAGVMNFQDRRLGHSIYALTYIDKPVGRRSQRFRYKIGFGLAHITGRYDPITNPLNIAISSQYSYALRGELFWTESVAPAWQLRTGMVLTHFSNGAFKMPNAGVNIVSWGVSLQHVPVSQRQGVVISHDTIQPAWHKGFALNTSAAFTIKEAGEFGERKFPGMVLSAYLSRRFSARSAWLVGLDATFDTAVRDWIQKDPLYANTAKPDWSKAAVTIGHELFIGRRTSLVTQLGIYVYSPYPPWLPVYQRYGLKYHVSKRSYGLMALKCHLGTADFVEWTVGTRFGK